MRGAGSKAVAFARAVALLGALIVGVPWLLVLGARERFGGAAPLHGVPHPSEWDATRIRGALTERLTDDTITDVVIRIALVVAWLSIAVVVVTVVAEVVHMVRHDGLALPPVRGLGAPQALARVIATGLLVVVPMLSGPSKAVARDGVALVPEPRAAAVAEDATPAAGELGARPDRVWWSSSDAGSGRAMTGVPASPVAAPSPPGQYVVRAGDSIYAIAERLAGPDAAAVAAYADALLELNLGRSMADGQRFTNAAYVDVGWVLQLPEPPPLIADNASTSVGHVVRRGESLWSIAEDELGDPARWPEIYEANRGRTFDDGRVLDDPDLIHPGWQLDVPGQAHPSEPPAQVPSPSTTEAVAPAVDARTVDDVERAQPPPPPPASNAVDDGPDVAPPDTAAPDQVWERSPSAPGIDRDGARRGDADAGVDDGASGVLTVGHAAMLSAGVLTLLAVRRRQRLRRARPREVVDPPGPRPAATERALRSTDTGERRDRLTAAIDGAAPEFVAAGERLMAALVSPDGTVELIASGAISLPGPWRPAGPDRWAVSAATPIELITASTRSVTPCPALVQLGRDADGRDVYVDLEAIEALEVGGPADDAEAIVAAIAMTLAASVAAEVTTLVGLGVPDEAFLGHRLHRPVRDAQRAFEEAADAIGATAFSTCSTFELRAGATGGEAWEPAVVLVGAAAGTIVLPPSRSGLAVVSASPIDGPASRLVPDGSRWSLLPLGIALTPVGLRTDDLRAVAELVRVPTSEPEPPPEGESSAKVVATAADDDPDVTILVAADRPAGPEWSLLVRLLGGVDVVDAAGDAVDFERSKTRELVAWLATHRERSTRSAARTALWELDVRDATFNNVVSEARRALARLVDPPDGEEWIARTMTDALPLHDHVRTDGDVLAAALDVARVAAPDEAISVLTPAVELVRGVPFEGTSYLWPDAEGLTSELVLLATTAAAELGAHCLSVGDTAGVFDATGRGLQVLPGHEELIGLRMRAHARVGDHAGVRYEWESYERVIVADPWSDGEPSPKLVELRRTLISPSR